MLRQRQFVESHDQALKPQKPRSTLYEEYVPINHQDRKWKEVVFFVRLAVFCLLTIFSSFLFLSFSLNAFFSLTLAIFSSVLLIMGYLFFLKK